MPPVAQAEKTKQEIRTQTTAIRPVAPAGSILSRAVPVSLIKDDFIKMLIYGHNRSGKTTLACQFEKPLLLISFEPTLSGGAKSVKKVPGVEFVKLTSTEDAKKLADELKGDTTFKTHVLDTITSLQDVILQELLGYTVLPDGLAWGTVTDDQYRQRSEKAREIVRKYLNLHAHTVVLAKEKDHNPKAGERKNKLTQGLTMRDEAFYGADTGTATAGWLNDACDYICRLTVVDEVKTVKRVVEIAGQKEERVEEVETGKRIRRLLTAYHPNFQAGFRSENPKMVPEYIDEPTYEKILAVMEGKPIK